jgi:hypothetical protein
VVNRHFGPDGTAGAGSIGTLEFADGTTWYIGGDRLLAGIGSTVGGGMPGYPSSPSVTIERGVGDRVFYAFQTSETLGFGAGITEDEIELSRSGNDLVVRLAGSSDQITLVGNLPAAGSDPYGSSAPRVSTLSFADGSTMWLSSSAQYGTDGADSFVYAGYGGGQTFYGGGLEDRIQLGANISASSVELRRSGTNLEIIDHGGGSMLVVDRHFGPDGTAGAGSIGTLEFANGVTWDISGDRLSVDTTGNDVFSVERGSGSRSIFEAGGWNDTLTLGPDITGDQVWFERKGDDLRVSAIGTGDGVDIHNWYADSQRQVDRFQTADGKVLMAYQVEQLRSAMAAFSPPPSGQLELTAEQHAALDPVIASSWT